MEYCRDVVPARLLMQPGGPVRQPYSGVDLISPVRIYEFGYRGIKPILNDDLKNIFTLLVVSHYAVHGLQASLRLTLSDVFGDIGVTCASKKRQSYLCYLCYLCTYEGSHSALPPTTAKAWLGAVVQGLKSKDVLQYALKGTQA